jgi:hypothetical protein
MRENRLSGSEGGGTETNQSFLPLSISSFPGVATRHEGSSDDLEYPLSSPNDQLGAG